MDVFAIVYQSSEKKMLWSKYIATQVKQTLQIGILDYNASLTETTSQSD